MIIMRKEYYFTLKDFTYIAATVAILYIVAVITKLTIGAIPIPGMKTIIGAFFSTIVISIGLMWIRKLGTFTLIMLVYGIISGFIFPAIPFLSLIVIGGLAGDLTAKLLGAKIPNNIIYEDRIRIILACGVCYFVISVVLFYAMIFLGYPTAILRNDIIFLISIVCFFLALLGSSIGVKIATELRRAGVI